MVEAAEPGVEHVADPELDRAGAGDRGQALAGEPDQRRRDIDGHHRRTPARGLDRERPGAAAGKLFPKADRAPAIVPVTEGGLRRRIAREQALVRFAVGRTRRVNSGFYLSNAIELRRQPSPSVGEAAR